MTASGLQIRPLGRDDDLEPELALRRRAFGPMPAGDKPRWQASLRTSIDAGQLFGAFDHGRLVASARYFDMRQWWHGRSLPMAGVAAVMVAPEFRGRGVGRTLMTAFARQLRGRAEILRAPSGGVLARLTFPTPEAGDEPAKPASRSNQPARGGNQAAA